VGVSDGVISRAFIVVGGITVVGVGITVQADNHTSKASEDRRNASMAFAPLGL
jgi:small neutral amino acid transporter SnatA (MarC family)